MQDSMETKRLFVGGLFKDVSEEELRAKFGHFGEVTDVHIVHKADSKGNVVNTFSYIDMKLPQGNYDRCVNIFDKSKWKGGQLSVQLAKESFLEKLAKERSESAKGPTCEAKPSSDNDSPQPAETRYQVLASKARLTNKAPGTKVPGATDWVVGKYGMVLPVVQLRNLSGRKVVRYDPSMHCHRIKRFREDEGEVSGIAVGELDLGLDQMCYWGQHNEDKGGSEDLVKPVARNLKRAKNAGKKEEKTNKNCQLEVDRVRKRFDDVIANDKKEVITVNVRNDIEERSRRGSRIEKATAEKQCIKSIWTQTSPQLSLSIVQQIELRNRTASQENTKSVAASKRSPSALLEDDALYSVQSLVTEATSAGDGDVLIKRKKRRKEQAVNDVKKAKQPVKEEPAEEGNPTLKKSGVGRCDKQGEKSSDYFDLDKRASGVMKTEKWVGTIDRSDTQSEGNLESAVLSAWAIQDQDSHSPAIERLSERGDDHGERALLSEQKRLCSVNRLRNARLKQQNIIKSSLQNLDMSRKGKQHITFEEDENGGEKEEEMGSAQRRDRNEDEDTKEQVANKRTPASQRKISGSASLSWLGLDEEEEDEATDASKENVDLFPSKPHFEGEKGHKLFKLQQAIGSDTRFTLSEKFLESDGDEDVYPETERESRTEDIVASSTKVGESDVDLELREERERSLRILQGVLGTTVTSGNAANASRKTWDFVRFDPSVESHGKFEVKVPEEALELTSTDKDNSDKAQGGKENEEKNAQVSEDRYYDVSASLRDLFGKKEHSGFSFLSENDEKFTASPNDVANAEAPLSEAVAIDADEPRPVWAQALFVRDMDANSNVKDAVAETQNNRCDKKPRFFYSADDQRLQGVNEDDHLLFMRTETEEQIEEYWSSVRKRLTEDFKRKHKDAVRWRRKMLSKTVRR